MKALLEREDICGIFTAASEIMDILKKPHAKGAVYRLREKAADIEDIISMVLDRQAEQGRDANGQEQ